MLQPIEGDSGLHLSVHLVPSIDAQLVSRHADERGHRIQALNRLGTTTTTELNGFMFGFGLMDVRGIERSVEALALLLRAAVQVVRRVAVDDPSAVSSGMATVAFAKIA